MGLVVVYDPPKRGFPVPKRFVGLVRVSTTGQEESGLGLEAGRADLDQYVRSVNGELIHVFTEVESGAHDEIVNRPTLLNALRLCKRRKACLLVPKVDRLVRSTSVHTDIRHMKVPFQAVNNPVANEFTLDILVAVAAQEARAISDRTKTSAGGLQGPWGRPGSQAGHVSHSPRRSSPGKCPGASQADPRCRRGQRPPGGRHEDGAERTGQVSGRSPSG